jgi:hypothetical protein
MAQPEGWGPLIGHLCGESIGLASRGREAGNTRHAAKDAWAIRLAWGDAATSRDFSCPGRGTVMSKLSHKKKIAALAAAVVVAAGAGAAYAYWTQGGAGTGSATTGTTTAVVVNQTNAAVTGLFPGGPAGALSGNFNNPNSGPVAIGVVTASVTATSVPACDATWYEIVGTATPASQTLASGSGVGSWSGLSVRLNNDLAVNQDACKGASITITYAVPAGA